VRIVLAAVLCALLIVPAAAGAQTLRGVVLDDATGAPVPTARIELRSVEAGLLTAAESDRDGRFALTPRQAGRYVLRVTHLGYEPLDSVAVHARAGESVQLELRLGRTAIPLEPVVVVARRRADVAGFYERMQRGGMGSYVTREEIDRRPASRASDLLRTMPGIRVESTGANRSVVTMRGGLGRCLPTIYLDGMHIRQYPESGVDDWILPASLEGIEVYTSFASAPSPLHAQGACGVIAFWTRTENGKPWTWRRFAVAAGFVLGVLLFAVR
jgi:hypothetical protein